MKIHRNLENNRVSDFGPVSHLVDLEYLNLLGNPINLSFHSLNLLPKKLKYSCVPKPFPSVIQQIVFEYVEDTRQSVHGNISRDEIDVPRLPLEVNNIINEYLDGDLTTPELPVIQTVGMLFVSELREEEATNYDCFRIAGR